MSPDDIERMRTQLRRSLVDLKGGRISKTQEAIEALLRDLDKRYEARVAAEPMLKRHLTRHKV